MTTVGAPGGVGFGPVVDDDLVPGLPGKLLSEGKYHRTLRGLVSANNAHEVCTIAIRREIRDG